MFKQIKRILAILLTATLLMAAAPLMITAATQSGACGDNANWTFDTSTGILNITGTGDIERYVEKEMPWYSYKESIQSVQIAVGITSIGNLAFFECTNLTYITIPNSVTSIGKWALSDCIKLTSVTIPNSVTSFGDGAFEYCTSLTSVTIPNSVTSIGKWAFMNCIKLTSVTIPNSVTSFESGAFLGCISLTSVTIPNSVTSIADDAFDGCPNLTIKCYKDSAAHKYAVENKIPFLLIGSGVVVPQPTTTIPAFSTSSPLAATYALTVVNGTGSGNYAPGATVAITAQFPPDSSFDKWVTTEETLLGDMTSAITTFKMPASAVTVTATFKAAEAKVKIPIKYYNDDKAETITKNVDFWNGGTFLTRPANEAYPGTANWKNLAWLSAMLSKSIQNGPIAENFTSLGLTDTVINTSDSLIIPGYALGKKTFEIAGETFELFVVVYRGTTTNYDILTDVFSMLDAWGDAAGQEKELLEEYYQAHSTLDREHSLFLITGHSLGGAMANIVANDLIEDNSDWKANIWAFTFGCPNTVMFKSSCYNISNFISVTDWVPMTLPPVGMHHGQNYRVTTDGAFNDPHNCTKYAEYIETMTGKGETSFTFQWLTVQCPVDVEVLDANNKTVARITNNTVQNTGEGSLTAAVFGDDKYICVPDSAEYTVKLTGTDTGTMAYSVCAKDLLTEEMQQAKSFSGVALTAGKQFTSKVGGEAVAEVQLFVTDGTGAKIAEVQTDGVETSPADPAKGHGAWWLYLLIFAGAGLVLLGAIVVTGKRRKKSKGALNERN